jgi:hypothetical protein
MESSEKQDPEWKRKREWNLNLNQDEKKYVAAVATSKFPFELTLLNMNR